MLTIGAGDGRFALNEMHSGAGRRSLVRHQCRGNINVIEEGKYTFLMDRLGAGIFLWRLDK